MKRRGLLQAIVLLSVSMFLHACGGESEGEDDKTKWILGDYSCSSFIVNSEGAATPLSTIAEIVELSLKEGGKFTSSGFKHIDPDLKDEGSWKLEGKRLILEKTEFEIKSSSANGMTLECKSEGDVTFELELSKN